MRYKSDFASGRCQASSLNKTELILLCYRYYPIFFLLVHILPSAIHVRCLPYWFTGFVQKAKRTSYIGLLRRMFLSFIAFLSIFRLVTFTCDVFNLLYQHVELLIISHWVVDRIFFGLHWL